MATLNSLKTMERESDATLSRKLALIGVSHIDFGKPWRKP